MFMRRTRKYRQGPIIMTLLLALGLVLTACSSTPPKPAPQMLDGKEPAPVERRLRRAAHDWEGTPHRLGGLDRHGIDCSGLVVRIYADLFGYRLPRTTGALARTGQPAAQGALAPGDLVLFRIPGGKQHVGIYLGQEEFVHTSTTRGVMISRLDERYWRRTFWTARRILH